MDEDAWTWMNIYMNKDEDLCMVLVMNMDEHGWRCMNMDEHLYEQGWRSMYGGGDEHGWTWMMMHEHGWTSICRYEDVERILECFPKAKKHLEWRARRGSPLYREGVPCSPSDVLQVDAELNAAAKGESAPPSPTLSDGSSRQDSYSRITGPITRSKAQSINLANDGPVLLLQMQEGPIDTQVN